MPLTVTDNERQELAVTYAALILSDDGADISEENINKLLNASKNKVEPFYPKLFAQLLKGKDVSELLLSAGGGGGGAAPAAGGAAAAGGDDTAAAAAAPEEEEESESDGVSCFVPSWVFRLSGLCCCQVYVLLSVPVVLVLVFATSRRTYVYSCVLVTGHGLRPLRLDCVIQLGFPLISAACGYGSVHRYSLSLLDDCHAPAVSKAVGVGLPLFDFP